MLIEGSPFLCPPFRVGPVICWPFLSRCAGRVPDRFIEPMVHGARVTVTLGLQHVGFERIVYRVPSWAASYFCFRVSSHWCHFHYFAVLHLLLASAHVIAYYCSQPRYKMQPHYSGSRPMGEHPRVRAKKKSMFQAPQAEIKMDPLS
jgi:hypothetical protein